MNLENYRRSVSEAKRASILKSGREIFLRDGFTRASVAEIARDADVSTATLYKHFSSKEQLFAAVVRDAAKNIQDYTDLAGTETDFERLFIVLSRAYLTMQFDHKFNDLMRIVIAESGTNPQLAREIAVVIGDRRINGLKAVLDRLVARGLLKPHDTMLGAQLASGMIKELFVWPALFDMSYAVPADADEKIRAAMEIYFARYGVHPPGGRNSS